MSGVVDEAWYFPAVYGYADSGGYEVRVYAVALPRVLVRELDHHLHLCSGAARSHRTIGLELNVDNRFLVLDTVQIENLQFGKWRL